MIENNDSDKEWKTLDIILKRDVSLREMECIISYAKGYIGADYKIDLLSSAEFKNDEKEAEWVFYNISKNNQFVAFLNGRLYPKSKNIEGIYCDSHFGNMLKNLKSTPLLGVYIIDVKEKESEFVMENFKAEKNKKLEVKENE